MDRDESDVDLSTIDENILDLLAEGRCTRQYLAVTGSTSTSKSISCTNSGSYTVGRNYLPPYLPRVSAKR
jgi:hypothetical protein